MVSRPFSNVSLSRFVVRENMSVILPSGKAWIIVLFVCVSYAECRSLDHDDGTTEVVEKSSHPERRNFLESSGIIEKYFKSTVKDLLKIFLPGMINIGYESKMSGRCMRSLVKLISDLAKAKIWAIRMLDASSKLPSGILEGTLSDYGDIDECLGILVPASDGREDFRGRFCAVEGAPHMPPVPENFSLLQIGRAGMMDTVADEVRTAGTAMHYLRVRVGVCVPSVCSREDIAAVADIVADRLNVEVEVPQCYVKETVKFETVHILVTFVVASLVALVVVGTICDFWKDSPKHFEKNKLEKFLCTFSLRTNLIFLLSPPTGKPELRCLHGLRAASIFWVMVGQTFVSFNGQLVKHPSVAQKWALRPDFEPVANSWLVAESFFFLSGLLSCLTVLKAMSENIGKFSVPLCILRRYIRMTVPLLLVTGFAFFLPLVSSGPFWYEKVAPEIKKCESYWWTNLLYVGNWLGINKLCMEPTWFLSADFQMYILSFLILIPLFRSAAVGFTIIVMAALGCIAGTGALIYVWNLPPAVQLTSARYEKIQETMDVLYINTIVHVGPYCIGTAVGYLIFRYKDIKMSKVTLALGWCASCLLSASAVYGLYRWDIGEGHDLSATVLYGALHRSLFALGIAWVTYVCVTGNAGIVNFLLSFPLLIPLSRLTYMIYLLHTLVILVRAGTMRERLFVSYYNELYEFIANVATSVTLSVVLYLLLEAPLSNLEKLAFSQKSSPQQEKPSCIVKIKYPNGISTKPSEAKSKSTFSTKL